MNYSKIFIENSNVSRARIRKLIIKHKLIPYECLICNNRGIWRGKKITLPLDHKNGIHNDHRINNLRFLCPNCHQQCPTTNSRKSPVKNIILEPDVIELYKISKNIRQILLKLNVADSGSNYLKIKKILEDNNLYYLHNASFNIKKIKNPQWRQEPRLQRRKVPRPSKEELTKLVWKEPCTKIASRLGISSSNINKWCKKYGIPKPPRGFWEKCYHGTLFN